MPIETPSNQPAEWLKQQARHVLWECDEYGIEPRVFLHDNDRCYSEGFDIMLKNTGHIRVLGIASRNSSVTKWVTRHRILIVTRCIRVIYGVTNSWVGY
jgi:hypothetical protein